MSKNHFPKKSKILVIGDSCKDIFRYGSIDRLAPEAPVPVIKPMYENSQPPERVTLTFPRNAKEDRDRLLSEMQRVLREKTWQPAPVVYAAEIAAPAPAPDWLTGSS